MLKFQACINFIYLISSKITNSVCPLRLIPFHKSTNSTKINLIYSQLKILLIDKIVQLSSFIYSKYSVSISIVFSSTESFFLYTSYILYHSLLNNPASKYHYYGNRTRKAFSITTTTCFISTPYYSPSYYASFFAFVYSSIVTPPYVPIPRLKLRFKSANPFEDHHSIPYSGVSTYTTLNAFHIQMVFIHNSARKTNCFTLKDLMNIY